MIDKAGSYFNKLFIIKVIVVICVGFIQQVAAAAVEDEEMLIWVRNRVSQPFRAIQKTIEEKFPSNSLAKDKINK